MTHRPPWVLVAVFALVGFLLVVTGTATSAANESQQPRRTALIDQILQQRRNVGDLDQAVTEVRSQVSDAHKAAGAASNDAQSRERNEQQASLQAGTTALKGRGLVVKLSDAPRPEDADKFKFDSNRIQDSDIQLIVNALFATGAQAVAINDNRVVAVTPIRAAGGTIVVNYRPVRSPYRISAIGVDDDKFSSSDIVDHFNQWKKKFDLGFDIEHSKNISVPAYSGRVSSVLAQPVVPATAAPSTTTAPVSSVPTTNGGTR